MNSMTLFVRFSQSQMLKTKFKMHMFCFLSPLLVPKNKIGKTST